MTRDELTKLIGTKVKAFALVGTLTAVKSADDLCPLDGEQYPNVFFAEITDNTNHKVYAPIAAVKTSLA